ncbi:MAG TPA: hypothetical protein VMV89_12570 [Candidatus Paceibacterota bacterium]|nr:hypothetical protein [Candidatus Paceibacterota bacterium]
MLIVDKTNVILARQFQFTSRQNIVVSLGDQVKQATPLLFLADQTGPSMEDWLQSSRVPRRQAASLKPAHHPPRDTKTQVEYSFAHDLNYCPIAVHEARAACCEP